MSSKEKTTVVIYNRMSRLSNLPCLLILLNANTMAWANMTAASTIITIHDMRAIVVQAPMSTAKTKRRFIDENSPLSMS